MRNSRYHHPLSLKSLLLSSLFVVVAAALCFLFLATPSASAEPYEGEYHSLAEVEDELVDIHNDYPDITELYDLADYYGAEPTHKGRTIYALKISDNPEVEEENEEDVLIVATHHAREWISYEVVLYFTERLLENYTGSPTEGEGPDVEYLSRSDYLINNREFWIVPVVNPDGLNKSHERNDRQNNWTGWRKNLRDNNGNGQEDYGDDGVDLNRNYGYMWGHDDSGSSPNPSSSTYRGPSAWSEPENRMIRALVEDEDHDFRTALTYHSKGEMILYPFGYEALDPEEHFTQFTTLAREMTYWSGYEAGNYKSGTIYKVNGDMVDYLYGEHEVIVYTIELGKDSDRFIPDESRIVPISKQNLEQNYLISELAPYHHTIYIYKNCEDFEDVDHRDEAWNLSEAGDERFGGERSWVWRSDDDGSGVSSLTIAPMTITEGTVLSFWQRYELEGESGAFVSVEKNHDGNWRKVIPLGGYDADDGNHGLVYREKTGWHKELFDLSPFVGEKDDTGKATIRLRFTAAGKSGSAGSFWCIDDVAVYEEELGIDYDLNFDCELSETSFAVVAGQEVNLTITLTNTGNTMNSLKLRVAGQAELEENGFNFEFTDIFFSLEPGEEKTSVLSFRTSEPLFFEERVEIRLKASSDFPDYPQKITEIEVGGAAVVQPYVSAESELFYVTPEEWMSLFFTVRNGGTMNNTVFETGVEVLNPAPNDQERWRVDIPEIVVLGAFEEKEIELRINASRHLSYPREKRFRLVLIFSEEKTRELNPGKDLSDLVIESSSSSYGYSVYLVQYMDGSISKLSYGSESWGDEQGEDDSWKQGLVVVGVSPGKDNIIELFVLNKGNVGYPFSLTVQGMDWDFRVLVDGSEKNWGIVEFSGSERLELEVTPPENSTLDETEHIILQLYLSTTLVDSFPVRLTCGPSYFFATETVEPLGSEERVDVVPGNEYDFALELFNTGNTLNHFTFETSLDASWQPRFTHGESDFSADSPLELEPQEEVEVIFHIMVPKEMSFNQYRYCEITIKDLGGGAEEAFPMEFRALKYYDVAVSVDTDDLVMRKGEPFSVLVTVENKGNAPCEVNLSVEGLPPHWQWQLAERQLSVRDSRTVLLEVMVPDDDSVLGVDSLVITADAGDETTGYTGASVDVSLSYEKVADEGEEDGLSGWVLPVALAIFFGGAAGVVLVRLYNRKENESTEASGFKDGGFEGSEEGDWEEEHEWDDSEEDSREEGSGWGDSEEGDWEMREDDTDDFSGGI